MKDPILVSHNFSLALYENFNVSTQILWFSLCGSAGNINTGGFGSAFIVSHTIACYVVYRNISGLPFFTVGDKIVCKIMMGK